MTNTPALGNNLDEIEMILEECGATCVRTITDARWGFDKFLKTPIIIGD